MRILQVSGSDELKRIMRDIGVDPYGVNIMAPKGVTYVIRINSLACIAANILKQEMLSLGADVAVSKYTLTGKTRKTDCILLGNSAQLTRLNEKLKKQPFGLNRLASELTTALANYEKRELRPVNSRVMGILNLTPDSFSGDGFYRLTGGKEQQSAIIDYAEKIVQQGADIIDIGAESSRPGAKPVALKKELSRVIPVIKALAKRIRIPMSVDTYKPEVAYRALDSGAKIINDITGLRNPKMAKAAAKFNAAVVIMHMKGAPRTMQNNPSYTSLIDELIGYFTKAIDNALFYGIRREKIIIDPGIGFGKTVEHNLCLLKRLSEFKILGCPILVGPSRKSFIGKILNNTAEERLSGTIASCVLAVKNGANIVRVHDVKQVKEALKIADAIINS